MQEEEAQKKPNPVVQRVKIIMALGLTVVHLHGWFLSGITGLSFGLALQTEGAGVAQKNLAPASEIEKVPLQDYILWKAFNLSGDQVLLILWFISRPLIPPPPSTDCDFGSIHCPLCEVHLSR